MPPYRICFVCMGNICRSPMAEVVIRHRLAAAGLAGRVVVDSGGTSSFHLGKPADARAVAVLADHGYDGTAHLARQFDAGWFAGRDLVVAMDGKNVQALRWLAPEGQAAKIVRLRSFDPASAGGDLDVADPYYGELADYVTVLRLVEAAAAGLISHVRAALTAREPA